MDEMPDPIFQSALAQLDFYMPIVTDLGAKTQKMLASLASLRTDAGAKSATAYLKTGSAQLDKAVVAHVAAKTLYDSVQRMKLRPHKKAKAKASPPCI